MRFSAVSIIAIAALTNGVFGAMHYRGMCVDKNDKGFKTIFNDAATKQACVWYRAARGNSKTANCADCEYIDDPKKEGDEQCLSKGGNIGGYEFEQWCIQSGALTSVGLD